MQKNEKNNARWTRRSMLLAGLAGTTVALTGCPLLFVGWGGVGVMSAMNRRATGAQVDDLGIEIRASQDLSTLLGPDKAHINVTSFNRQVLLTGEVANSEDKIVAEEAVKRVNNVRSVVNALAVGPVTSLGNRTNDSMITGKVKAALANTEGVPATQVKVVTERSVVYLMGIVTAREAQLASQTASSVIGVQKVVRVFEIMTEEDLARINAQGNPSQVQ